MIERDTNRLTLGAYEQQAQAYREQTEPQRGHRQDGRGARGAVPSGGAGARAG
ncbi:hypothetical protein [Intrasporangium sp. DVR]|uniref:hypothetical protein n=1 Tax=Intrasporangium sp. DVR TaxID=3127867 RepID=UPI00313A5978